MAYKHTLFTDAHAFPAGMPADVTVILERSVPVAYNGQTLEGILWDERIPGSLLPCESLSFAGAPKAGSTCFKQSMRLKELFEEWLEPLQVCDPVELDFTAMRFVYSLHQHNLLPRRDFASRKSLPKHVANDRRDPIALIVTAVQLLHDALPSRGQGRAMLDIGRFVYVLDRLREAELAQVSRRDVRFDALKALSAFVGAAVAKHDSDCPICVETL